jgi:N-acetyl-anhydromuramyl-L-alanine amidase AmpD
MNIIQKPVKNFTKGRAGYKVEAIVLHISQGNLNGAYSWFNDSTSQVSSHFMIGKKGEVWQFINTDDTAWHAGGINKPNWPLLKPQINPNQYTIGIEFEGLTGETFTEAMYNSSAELIGYLCKEYNIPLDRNHIIGHYQINSVSRAQCPGIGLNFDKMIQLSSNKFYEDPQMIKDLQGQIDLLRSQLNKANADLYDVNIKFNDLAKGYADLKAGNTVLKEENTALINTNEQFQEYKKTIFYKIYLLFKNKEK